MKAIVSPKLQGPKNLSVMEVDEPKIAPDEILVETRAYGLNFGDALMSEGAYQVKLPPPYIVGSEFSGICIEVGSQVQGIKPGDRVSAMDPGGAFAERVKVKGYRSVAVPESMNDETAAGFYSGYLTSYYGLIQRGRLEKNETLLVLGAGGGVGLAAVDIGSSMGANVIAVDGPDKKLELARQCGADITIDYRSADMDSELRSHTDNKGVDVVFDLVGGDMFDICCRRVRWNGRYLVIGFASGRIPKFPINLCLVKGYSLVGVRTDDYLMFEPENSLKDVSTLNDMYTSGLLSPKITVIRGFSQIPSALDQLYEGKTLGKVVVTYDE